MLKYRILSTHPAATFPAELTSHTPHEGAEGVNRDKMEPETVGGALRAGAGGGGRGGEAEEGEEEVVEEEEDEESGRCAIETKRVPHHWGWWEKQVSNYVASNT